MQGHRGGVIQAYRFDCCSIGASERRIEQFHFLLSPTLGNVNIGADIFWLLELLLVCARALHDAHTLNGVYQNTLQIQS